MENKILIIDIETTGFLNENGKIVEVGIVELNVDNGELKVLFDSIVREEDMTVEELKNSWIVTKGYMVMEEILHAPYLFMKLPEIQRIINKYPNGATAYNRNFDFDFLESRGIVFIQKLGCPMKISTNVCKLPGRNGSYKWPKVEEAYEFLFGKTGYVEAHRGADDAMHEGEIVYELIKRNKFNVTW